MTEIWNTITSKDLTLWHLLKQSSTPYPSDLWQMALWAHLFPLILNTSITSDITTNIHTSYISLWHHKMHNQKVFKSILISGLHRISGYYRIHQHSSYSGDKSQKNYILVFSIIFNSAFLAWNWLIHDL